MELCDEEKQDPASAAEEEELTLHYIQEDPTFFPTAQETAKAKVHRMMDTARHLLLVAVQPDLLRQLSVDADITQPLHTASPFAIYTCICARFTAHAGAPAVDVLEFEPPFKSAAERGPRPAIPELIARLDAVETKLNSQLQLDPGSGRKEETLRNEKLSARLDIVEAQVNSPDPEQEEKFVSLRIDHEELSDRLYIVESKLKLDAPDPERKEESVRNEKLSARLDVLETKLDSLQRETVSLRTASMSIQQVKMMPADVLKMLRKRLQKNAAAAGKI